MARKEAAKPTAAAAAVVDAVAVPGVLGLTLDKATAQLEDLGFKVEAKDTVDGKSIMSKKNWQVTSQDPTEGASAAKGSTVNLGVKSLEKIAAEKAAADKAAAEKAAAEKAAAEAAAAEKAAADKAAADQAAAKLAAEQAAAASGPQARRSRHPPLRGAEVAAPAVKVPATPAYATRNCAAVIALHGGRAACMRGAKLRLPGTSDGPGSRRRRLREIGFRRKAVDTSSEVSTASAVRSTSAHPG